MVWENQTTGWLARKWEDPCQVQAGSRRGVDHCHHLDESGVESDGENDVESDGERGEKRVRGVDPYLIFVIFLHEQNFWRIKFTPKNA